MLPLLLACCLTSFKASNGQAQRCYTSYGASYRKTRNACNYPSTVSGTSTPQRNPAPCYISYLFLYTIRLWSALVIILYFTFRHMPHFFSHSTKEITVSTKLSSNPLYPHPFPKISKLLLVSHPVGCTPTGNICDGLPTALLSLSCGKCFRIILMTNWRVMSPATKMMRWLEALGSVRQRIWASATSRTST